MREHWLLGLACGCFIGAVPVSAMTQCGTASWYNAKDTLTAAHRSLPFGSKIQVENLDNGRTTTVEINDRGPFVPGRIIDVSRTAAEVLDFKGDGVTRVRISTAGSSTSSCP
jgi:peptidoglycan lytic transglycosylase